MELRFDEDPILREKCRTLSKKEVLSLEIQELIDDMGHTASERNTGVGISANQVGESVAITVIAIKPTPARPNLKKFDKVYINTKIVETFGEKELMWEGCLSTARDEYGEPAMGQVPRFGKVRIKYFDREAGEHEEVVEGFVAQVVQHETDHLNGVLFTDLIDMETLVPYREYCKMRDQ